MSVHGVGRDGGIFALVTDHVAGEIIGLRLVACMCVSVRLSVGALLFDL